MRDELVEIAEVIERCGVLVEGADATDVAREWLEAGFDDAAEVEAWLNARCFTPASAQFLDTAGLTSEQAAIRTRAGGGDYEDTVGFKITRGDLSLEEARRLITSDFWND